MEREQIIEQTARRLYEAWCRGFNQPDPPDWEAWQTEGDLNGNGLSPNHFREQASKVRAGIARVLCLNNGIPECSGCTFESCRGVDFFEEADAVLGGDV